MAMSGRSSARALLNNLIGKADVVWAADEASAELKEDYEVCVRMLSRVRDQKQQKPARRRKAVSSGQGGLFSLD
jgi:hypothetical protein